MPKNEDQRRGCAVCNKPLPSEAERNAWLREGGEGERPNYGFIVQVCNDDGYNRPGAIAEMHGTCMPPGGYKLVPTFVGPNGELWKKPGS